MWQFVGDVTKLFLQEDLYHFAVKITFLFLSATLSLSTDNINYLFRSTCTNISYDIFIFLMLFLQRLMIQILYVPSLSFSIFKAQLKRK